MLYRLDEFGVIQIAGKEAKKLLQGQLTCDVETLENASATLGAHCDPNGRVVSLFYLFSRDENYYLLLPASMIPLTLAAFKKYAIFYKVSLSDVSDRLCAFGYEAQEFDKKIAASILAQYRMPSSFMRYLILCTRLEAQKWEAEIVNSTRWDQWDISDCIPRIYPQTARKLLPHDIGLPQLKAVSFEKGCFTGQEIIARMHYKAKLKKHLVAARIQVATMAEVGTEVSFLQEDNTEIHGLLLMASPVDSLKQQWMVLLMTSI